MTESVNELEKLQQENERLAMELSVAQAQVAALRAEAGRAQMLLSTEINPVNYSEDDVLNLNYDAIEAYGILESAIEETQATAETYEKRIKEPLEAQVAALVDELAKGPISSTHASVAYSKAQATAQAYTAKIRQEAVEECIAAVWATKKAAFDRFGNFVRGKELIEALQALLPGKAVE